MGAADLSYHHRIALRFNSAASLTGPIREHCGVKSRGVFGPPPLPEVDARDVELFGSTDNIDPARARPLFDCYHGGVTLIDTLLLQLATTTPEWQHLVTARALRHGATAECPAIIVCAHSHACCCLLSVAVIMQLPPPLLAAPLLCSPSTHELSATSATLLLPRRSPAQHDVQPVIALTMQCMPMPSPRCQRPEHEWLVASQRGWSLSYCAVQRRFTWRIDGVAAAQTAPDAASSPLELRSRALTSPSAIVCLSHDISAAIVRMYVDGDLHASHQLVTTLSSSLFAAPSLQVAGCTAAGSTTLTRFIGVITGVRLLRLTDDSELQAAHHALLFQSDSVGLSAFLDEAALKASLAFWRPPPALAEPLHSLAHLLAWRPGCDPLNLPRLPHPAPRCPAPSSQSRVLHCHDMAFREDTDGQHGTERFHAYAFRHWGRIDVLVYFSHARIAVPPTMWTNAAHRNGVKILANLCTEWAEGERENIRLIDRRVEDVRNGCTGLLPSSATSSNTALPLWQRYALQLVALAVEAGCDGWFLNIEAPLPADLQSAVAAAEATPETPAIPSAVTREDGAQSPESVIPCSSVVRLVEFIAFLREAMHAARPGSMVLWYDSVRAGDGRVKWQSELNARNAPFFDAADGILTDYHWPEDGPARSASFAANRFGVDRRRDVFTGIDLFGRGTFGGGGFATHTALDVISRAGTSVALFAPAWTYEGEGRRDRGWDAFQEAENQLWLGESPMQELPLLNGIPKSQDSLTGWDLFENGGSGWAVLPREDVAGQMCFATSHQWNRRQQIVDLLSCCRAEHLASCPPLRIRTEYAATPPNVADQYELHVALLDAHMHMLAEFRFEATLTREGWHHLSHTFRDYAAAEADASSSPPRFLRWQDGGKDAENWAGHFGVRIGECRAWIAPEEHADADVAVSSSSSVGVVEPERAPCIAQHITPRRMPLHSLLPFLHSFNTGNGRNFFRQGHAIPRRSIALPSNDVDTSNPPADSAHPWFNLSLQDVQTILPDALLGSGVTLNDESSTTVITVRCGINHDVDAFDGGSCVLFEAQSKPRQSMGSSLTSRDDAVELFDASVECEVFVFGPAPLSSPLPAAQDLSVSFVFACSCDRWRMALVLLLLTHEHDADSVRVVLDPAQCRLTDLHGGWTRAVTAVPAAMLDGKYVSAVLARLSYAESASDYTSETASLRLGEVRMHMRSSVALSLSQPNCSTQLQPATAQTLLVTPHFLLQSLTAEHPCGAWMIEWDEEDSTESNVSAAPLSSSSVALACDFPRLPRRTSVASYDVCINGCWQARVLLPRYFLQISGTCAGSLDLFSTAQTLDGSFFCMSKSILVGAVRIPLAVKDACESSMSLEVAVYANTLV